MVRLTCHNCTPEKNGIVAMLTSATIVNIQDAQRTALMEVLPVARDQIENLMLRDNSICLVADCRSQGFVSLRLLAPEYLEKLRQAARTSRTLNGRHGVYFTEGDDIAFIGYDELKSISVN